MAAQTSRSGTVHHRRGHERCRQRTRSCTQTCACETPPTFPERIGHAQHPIAAASFLLGAHRKLARHVRHFQPRHTLPVPRHTLFRRKAQPCCRDLRLSRGARSHTTRYARTVRKHGHHDAVVRLAKQQRERRSAHSGQPQHGTHCLFFASSDRATAAANRGVQHILRRRTHG